MPFKIMVYYKTKKIKLALVCVYSGSASVPAHSKMYYSGTLVHLWYSTTEVSQKYHGTFGYILFFRHLKIPESTQTEYMCGISEYNRVFSGTIEYIHVVHWE